MLLGCIADDFTGATDLALNLARAGMRTILVTDVSISMSELDEFDGVVVALKSRTIPVKDAIELALKSVDALVCHGARQLFFKYCSTFDSTDAGNIGPVADALMDKLGIDFTLACPAFPTNMRTIYLGNLFVGRTPLSESSMRDHPLTPMRDSNLVRVLQRQTNRTVGLIPFSTVTAGPEKIAAAFDAARKRNESYVIVDAITNENLIDIGTAARNMRLITGGSGMALGLPGNFIREGLMEAAAPAISIKAPAGRAAILSGSCSHATRGQIELAIEAGMPAFRVDPLAIAKGDVVKADLIAWAQNQPSNAPILIYSSADPQSVAQIQSALGRDAAGHIVENLLATAAVGLVDAGFTRLLVAGGETSGAVVNSLKISALETGPEIDPGVPWTRSIQGPPIVIALKSGNFGAPDFFLKAWKLLT
jgi:uncharacterized protein YgbK (DUF1537 family)